MVCVEKCLWYVFKFMMKAMYLEVYGKMDYLGFIFKHVYIKKWHTIFILIPTLEMSPNLI